MPLIDHSFQEEGHIYKSAGGPVLCLSDIISILGMSDHSAVPLAVLERASQRGTGFDRAVQMYLEGKESEIGEDILPCFKGFLAFMDNHEVSVAAPIQTSMCWQGPGTLLGCTPDLPLWVDGEFWIVDTKTIHPLSGKAEQQKHLAWRVQLEGQYQAFLESEIQDKPMKKYVLHCHPKLRPAENRRKKSDGHEYGNGYHLIPMNFNDAEFFESCVRVAVQKLMHGFEIDRR